MDTEHQDRRPAALRLVATALLGIGLILVVGRSWAASAGMPDQIGVRDGRLAACAGSPNCVSSQATEPGQRVEPLRCGSALSLTFPLVVEALLGMDRVDLVTADGAYVHATARTRVFRFIDDVELLADPEDGIVHVRSASRLRRADLGANRRRLEDLRLRVAAACATAP